MRTLLKLSLVELKLFSREPMTVVFALALPLVTLFVLGGVFGNAPDPEFYSGVGAMDFYTPAYVGLVLAAIGMISIPAHMAGNRDRGVLRRYRASLVPGAAVVGAEVAVSLVIGAASGVVLVAAAMLAYGVAAPVSPAGVLAAFVLSALCFSAIGAMLGSLLRTARAAQSAGVLLWFLMLFLGGAGPPPEVLKGALSIAHHLAPLTYAVGLLQGPWLGRGWQWGQSAVVLGIGMVAAVVTAFTYRWE
jgi:ABC-2 type transport system permease protein